VSELPAVDAPGPVAAEESPRVHAPDFDVPGGLPPGAGRTGGLPPGAGQTGGLPLALGSVWMTWTRRRVPRNVSRIAKGIMVFAALTLLADHLVGLGGAPWANALSILAYPLFLVSYLLGLASSARIGNVLVSEQGLQIRTGAQLRSVPVASIRAAMVVDLWQAGAVADGGVVVDIDLVDGDRVRLRVPGEAVARNVVGRLGFGAGGRRLRLDVMAPSRRLLHLPVAFLAYMVTFLGMVVLLGSAGTYLFGVQPLAALAIYELIRRAMRAPVVTVGSDAVTVSAVGREKTFPLRDVQTARALAGTFGANSVAAERRRALLELIEERRIPAHTVDQIARYGGGGEGLAAWRGQLTRIMNEGGYRTAASSVDEASEVLTSVQATADQRLGAALALRGAGEPGERIRVAAEGVADPALREALEAVAADETDEVLEKAVARMRAR